MVDKKVEALIKSLIEKARAAGPPVKKRKSTRGTSSLAQIIKTKDQADALMNALKAL